MAAQTLISFECWYHQTPRQDGPLLSMYSFFMVKFKLAFFPGRAMDMNHLLNIARGRDFEAFDRSVDAHINQQDKEKK